MVKVEEKPHKYAEKTDFLKKKHQNLTKKDSFAIIRAVTNVILL